MIHLKIYHSVTELPHSWDQLSVQDLFLKSKFLKALEDSSPSNISPYYVGVFSSEVLVGIVILQRVEMYMDDVFRKTSNQFFKRCGKFFLKKIVKGNALIVGNLMHTGQHGLFYDSDSISQDEFLQQVSKSIKILSQQIKETTRKKIRIVAFKDYFEKDPIHRNLAFFKTERLYKAQVQPNMIFDIKHTWQSPADYVSAFNKKYRRRYKTARKKCQDLTRQELSLEDIKNSSDQLYRLYENVSDNAGINSFKLHQQHFLHMKLQLGGAFKVFGYFLEKQLVGFYTLILNGRDLETYFLGYDQKLQHQYQMYLNMLFDMAFFGIEHQFERVIYARTAMEIKSSIGAEPFPMHIYVKHTNSVIANTVLKLIVKYGNPIREWEERHPFRV
ncbi:MAG: GNAT family N-acetyltransferase [Algicola sp.]|nr:GNAT family N-acetyltransferase [Algicola sp.]